MQVILHCYGYDLLFYGSKCNGFICKSKRLLIKSCKTFRLGCLLSSCLFFQAVAVTGRCHAQVRFHVLSEEGLVGEVELFGNFLDGLVRSLQAVLDVLHDTFVNQFERAFATSLSDDLRQVLGRVAQGIGK